MDPRTIKALAELTDEGRFEQIALAVLHHAEPLCAALSQQGVNASGKTRASPVDNIGFVRAARPAHMVVAHHTTAAERDLRAKWTAAGARIGDILKTAEVVAAERVRTPDLEATLFLTTNREPDERLVRDSVALGASHGITVEIWSRARLAHVLDTDPAGQWIRRVLLEIEQELLSPELLTHLSTASLESFASAHERGVWIGRDLDRRLLQSRQSVSFIMGESGSGKSVACFRTMSHWVAGGDYALILPEDVVEEATSLSGAILAALQRLHPQLADAPSALTLASTSRPLLLLVEDINHANNPSRAIEKIARWAGEPASSERRGAPAWRILCPLWPRAIHGLPDAARGLVEPMLVQPSPFTERDGIAAVEAKAKVADKSISTVGCHTLSTALGNDPLLIGLHEFGGTSTPGEIIADFVERAMRRCEGQTGRPAGELRAALSRLAEEMLERRRMSPTWTEILQWPGLHSQLDAIRQLIAAGAVVRLEGRSDRQVLIFRHDRVRDHLLVDAAAFLHSAGTMSEALLEDPFYASILGDLVYARVTDGGLLDRLSSLNPLAIFHAIVRTTYGTLARTKLVELAQAWLTEESNLTSHKRSLRHAMAIVLMDAEGPDIVSLAKLFPKGGPHERMVRLRNGDLDAGIEDCGFQYRWNRERWRQRQIEHAQIRHADTLVAQAETHLLDRDCDPRKREILLHLAGSIADPRLMPALLQSWTLDEGRLDRLEDYLWAFASCCTDENAEQALGPVCDAWSALPVTRNGSDPSPRDDLVSSEMRWAIERRPPGPAIDYLTRRGASEDLAWQIYYLLHAVDHPAALRFCVTEMGKARARSAQSYFINFRGGRDHWERRRDESGLHMSSANRALLRDLWQNPGGNPNERTAAFDLWTSSWGESDLGIMRASQDDVILGDRILQRRLERGDDTAIPLLLPKLERDDRRFWWQYTRTVWSEDLTRVLRSAFANRAAEIAADPNRDFDIDHVLLNAVIRLPRDLAEDLLLEHWGDASGSPQLVQAALYIGTDALLDRAADAIAKAEEPSKLFGYLTSHFGIKERGHPGLTRTGQIEALAPYFGLIEKETELDWLADGCNDRGWFDLRRRLLDPLLPHSRHCWSEERLSGMFDQLAQDPRGATWEIEAALEAGLEWDQIATCLRTWLTTDPPKGAMYAACAILEEHGRRCDLNMVSEWPGTLDESISATIANATFEVQRRTAD